MKLHELQNTKEHLPAVLVEPSQPSKSIVACCIIGEAVVAAAREYDSTMADRW
jgi:hypothetical protein